MMQLKRPKRVKRNKKRGIRRRRPLPKIGERYALENAPPRMGKLYQRVSEIYNIPIQELLPIFIGRHEMAHSMKFKWGVYLPAMGAIRSIRLRSFQREELTHHLQYLFYRNTAGGERLWHSRFVEWHSERSIFYLKHFGIDAGLLLLANPPLEKSHSRLEFMKSVIDWFGRMWDEGYLEIERDPHNALKRGKNNKSVKLSKKGIELIRKMASKDEIIGILKEQKEEGKKIEKKG